MLGCSFLFLSFLAFFLVFVASGGTGRYSQVSIFNASETRLVMEEQIREDGIVDNSDIFTTRLFHNKVINYSLTFISNYLEYFSGSFLFIRGGLPIWYSVPGMGVVYLVGLPFVFLGIILLATHKKTLYKIPLLWLLIAPVTAAITIDDIPNINRAIVFLVVIEIIAGYGIYRFISIIQPRARAIAISFISIFLLLNFLYFLHQYFVHAPVHKNWYRNEGFGEMVKTIKDSYNTVDKIVITKDAGGIYPLVLFYMQYDPHAYQSEGSPKDREYSGFGKFFFVPQSCPSIDKDSRFPKVNKTIYVEKGECKDQYLRQKIIQRKDGTRVFNINYEGIP